MKKHATIFLDVWSDLKDVKPASTGKRKRGNNRADDYRKRGNDRADDHRKHKSKDERKPRVQELVYKNPCWNCGQVGHSWRDKHKNITCSKPKNQANLDRNYQAWKDRKKKPSARKSAVAETVEDSNPSSCRLSNLDTASHYGDDDSISELSEHVNKKPRISMFRAPSCKVASKGTGHRYLVDHSLHPSNWSASLRPLCGVDVGATDSLIFDTGSDLCVCFLPM